MKKNAVKNAVISNVFPDGVQTKLRVDFRRDTFRRKVGLYLDRITNWTLALRRLGSR